jgi:hypothetical protein
MMDKIDQAKYIEKKAEIIQKVEILSGKSGCFIFPVANCVTNHSLPGKETVDDIHAMIAAIAFTASTARRE